MLLRHHKTGIDISNASKQDICSFIDKHEKTANKLHDLTTDLSAFECPHTKTQSVFALIAAIIYDETDILFYYNNRKKMIITKDKSSSVPSIIETYKKELNIPD